MGCFVLISCKGYFQTPILSNKRQIETANAFFMEEINHLHIGKMIRQELKNQGRSVTWFAAQLNCHRVNAHNILRRKNIDIELLIRISQILNYNFLEAIAKQL